LPNTVRHNKISQNTDKDGHIILLADPRSDQKYGFGVSSVHFEPRYWQEKSLVTGLSKGRHTTFFVEPFGVTSKCNIHENWVLRHYYRGGLVAKFISDSYFYTGLEKTRCYRELELLQQMIELGLPVPKPIAARVIQQGLFYRADLLMQKISAVDLVALLKLETIEPLVWQSIGKTIAEFHHHGIDHADLNAHNIMMDDKKNVWLIDFDRCSKKVISKNWQQKNIERLHRSFKKELGLHTKFYFSEENWNSFLMGYSSNQ